MDADGWRFLASDNFGTSSNNLLNAFVDAVQKLCTDLFETHIIEAFLSCRLIPLGKSPGHITIGVGETSRSISGKVIVSVLKEDVIKCSRTLQVAGQDDDIEAAIHIQ